MNMIGKRISRLAKRTTFLLGFGLSVLPVFADDTWQETRTSSFNMGQSYTLDYPRDGYHLVPGPVNKPEGQKFTPQSTLQQRIILNLPANGRIVGIDKVELTGSVKLISDGTAKKSFDTHVRGGIYMNTALKLTSPRIAFPGVRQYVSTDRDDIECEHQTLIDMDLKCGWNNSSVVGAANFSIDAGDERYNSSTNTRLHFNNPQVDLSTMGPGDAFGVNIELSHLGVISTPDSWDEITDVHWRVEFVGSMTVTYRVEPKPTTWKLPGNGVGPTAAVLWGSQDAMFLRGDEFLVYNTQTDTVRQGSPKPLGATWGLPAGFVPTSILDQGDRMVYIFSGDQFLLYNAGVGNVAQGPAPIASAFHNWPAGFVPHAAVNWGNGKAYFFSGKQYLRFDLATNSVDSGYPLETRLHWNGWPQQGFVPQAAINRGDGKVYFFDANNYIRFDIARDHVEGELTPIPNGWGRPNGIWPLSSYGPSYYIIAAHSDKYMEVPGASYADGGIIQQWSGPGGNNQRWKLNRVGPHYEIMASHSGKCLNVAGASQELMANVIQWGCSGGDNQKWELIPGAEGYLLKAAHSGKCMDVRGSSQENGADLLQYECHGGLNQQWKILTQDYNSFVLP
ncbi:MAG: hypothetical protein HOE54_00530 [Gammaproteobacteria bacterium]|nr:hypothetical protein [Gammaproteobacteria bacterium]MBT7371019.1 hypothetical protein [Gammaproteobacteria bacterium]